MARVFQGEPTWLSPLLSPLERAIYRVSGVDPAAEQRWTGYAAAVLAFNATGMVLLYALQRLQGFLPLNPQGFGPVTPDLAFNTAASFTTNTNWQAYAGESTMSYLTRMAGLTVQNFVSAATGIAVAVALIRGLARRSVDVIGNFWVDLVRAILYVLLPISAVVALFFVWQGIPQNLSPYVEATTLEGTTQLIAQGPVASQEAIKLLGTNGGGFFNANSAHPYENPTPLTNLIEMLCSSSPSRPGSPTPLAGWSATLVRDGPSGERWLPCSSLGWGPRSSQSRQGIPCSRSWEWINRPRLFRPAAALKARRYGSASSRPSCLPWSRPRQPAGP